MATQERFRSTINNNQAQRQAKGRRTGAKIFSQQNNGIENAHDLFTAPSPLLETKEKPEQQVRPKFTRFSIGSTSQQVNDGSSSSAAKNRTKRMMGRLKKGDNRGIASPSELSRVSTATRSPLETPQPTKQRQRSPRQPSPTSGINSPPAPVHEDDPEEEVDVPTQMASDDEVDEEEEKKEEAEEDDEEDGPPLPNDEVEEDVDDEEEEEEEAPMVEQNDTQSAVSVEDDMLPPAPPDSPERDDDVSELPSQKSFTQNSLDDQSEEEEDDSPGYSMPTSKPPPSAKALRKKKKLRKKLEKVKKSSKKRKKAQVVESSDEEEEVQVKPQKKGKKTKNRFATVFSPRGIPLPREYETVPVENLRENDEAEHNGVPCRRSKRARCPPLAYWKNEKLQYGPSEDMDANSDVAKMPVPKAVIKAKATPYKPRPVRKHVVTASAKKKSKSATIPAEEEPPAKFDSRKLRKKHKYLDDEEAGLWDDHLEDITQMKVVGYKSREDYHQLPLVQSRTKAEGNVVGKAAQVFSYTQQPDSDFVGYIMGRLVLPPRGIKDTESVGDCTQVFSILSGQPGAVEVMYADPTREDGGEHNLENAVRFLLGPGDMFRVPPGNCYRLQNHSKTTECSMTWTIIRPFKEEHEDDGSRQTGDSQSR